MYTLSSYLLNCYNKGFWSFGILYLIFPTTSKNLHDYRRQCLCYQAPHKGKNINGVSTGIGKHFHQWRTHACVKWELQTRKFWFPMLQRKQNFTGFHFTGALKLHTYSEVTLCAFVTFVWYISNMLICERGVDILFRFCLKGKVMY